MFAHALASMHLCPGLAILTMIIRLIIHPVVCTLTRARPNSIEDNLLCAHHFWHKAFIHGCAWWQCRHSSTLYKVTFTCLFVHATSTFLWQRHAGACDKCGLQWGDKDSQEMVTKVAREPTSAGPPRAGIWTGLADLLCFFYVWAAGVVVVVAAFGAAVHPHLRQVIDSILLL